MKWLKVFPGSPYIRAVIVIPLLYFIFSILWIYYSDYWVYLTQQDDRGTLLSQTIKGSLFVVISTLVIYFVVRRMFLKLQRSENRLRTLHENAPYGVFFQVDDKLVDVNPKCVEYLHAQSEDDLIGKPIFDVFHPNFHDIIRERIQHIHSTHTPVGILEEVMVALDGSSFHAEVSAHPIQNNHHHGVLVFFRNIERRKQSERLLRESEERFRLSLTELPFPTIIHAENNEVRFINRSWTEISGYTLDEIPTLDEWTSKAFGEGKEQVLGVIHSLYDIHERVDDGEFLIQTKSGEHRIWEFSSAPLGTDPNGVRLVISVAKDITEKRRQENIMNVFLENAPLMIAYFDSKWRHRWVNRHWEQTLGWSAEEARTQNLVQKMYPLQEDYQKVLDFIQEPTGQWGEFQTTTKQGDPIDTSWLVTRVEPEGYLAIGSDNTEKKRLERQLIHSQKMESIGRLAGGVAHDFNNILTVIYSYTDFALEEMQPDTELHDFLIQIKDAAQRAENLIRQLLAFSRKQICQPAVININQMILETDKMLRRLIGEDIEFVTLPGEDLWNIQVDPAQLEQVIFNLAVNARDAMPGGGRLIIETKNVNLDEHYAQAHYSVPPGEYVLLAVSDDGCGIPKDKLDEIFEPFYTTKETGKGTGLGLSTVHGIVKQSGGHIYVYSEEGNGTTFKIYLPRVKREQLEEIEHPAEENETNGTERIMVVEDEPMVSTVIKKILTNAGYDVVTTDYGVEALEMFHGSEKPFDLLITDVIMPKMSGKDLVDQLIPDFPDLKVIFISGYTDNVMIQHSILGENIHFLQKPFTEQDLLGKIRELLDET